MNRIAPLIVVIALIGGLSVVGLVIYYPPSRDLPKISGHHWHRSRFGATLYDDATGRESVSFSAAALGFPAQVCDFEHPLSACEYFETDTAALRWVSQQYNLKGDQNETKR